MKSLVVYYSRTGNTKKVAQQIAITISGQCDIDEIVSRKKYSGKFGYIKAVFDAIFKKRPLIKNIKNPEKYDLVVIGTPNWGGRMAAPVRSYIYKNKFKKVAFFCVQGGSGAERVIADMKKLLERNFSLSKSNETAPDFKIKKRYKPSAVFIINERDIKDNSYKQKVKDFCKKLK